MPRSIAQLSLQSSSSVRFVERVPSGVSKRFFATETVVKLPALDALAARHGLSAYDASYLELALRLKLPLATLDKALLEAMTQAGVAAALPPA